MKDLFVAIESGIEVMGLELEGEWLVFTGGCFRLGRQNFLPWFLVVVKEH